MLVIASKNVMRLREDGKVSYSFNIPTSNQSFPCLLYQLFQQVSDIPPESRLRHDQFETFVRMLPNCSDMELSEIIRKLRRQEDVSHIIGAVANNTLLQPLTRNDPTISYGLEAAYSEEGQTFGLVKGTRGSDNNHPHGIGGRYLPDAHSPMTNQPWTQVTDDQEFIEHLLSLYFSWQHSFFQSFPEKLFREDMASGRTKYCSTILVNAICAAGCLLSSKPEARRDPNNSLTAGLDFFEEAIRQLNDINVSTIPTTAALYLLCHVDGHRGRMSSLWMLCGRSMRMALDMNLHLRDDKISNETQPTLAKVHERARLHVYWGCFIGDSLVAAKAGTNYNILIVTSICSFTLGRLPQIPTNAITVELPPIIEEEDEEIWEAYGIQSARRSGAKSSTFNYVATLAKIVNSTLHMFFAPAQQLSGTLLLNEYDKYLNWYKKLPPALIGFESAPPHILCLQ